MSDTRQNAGVVYGILFSFFFGISGRVGWMDGLSMDGVYGLVKHFNGGKASARSMHCICRALTKQPPLSLET